MTVDPPFIVERPKVLFNNNTNEYVMWFHLDDVHYKFRHAGVAVATDPQGPWKFVHALQPDNVPSLDMSLWRDPLTSEAYFIRSCDNSYTGISRLTTDMLNTTGLFSKTPKYGDTSIFEGMAFFRLPNGTYYIVGSHLTGMYVLGLLGLF